MSDVSALILAGGKATRFGGIAKHELIVDGETIFARQVRVLSPRVAEILVSASDEVAARLPPIGGDGTIGFGAQPATYRNVRDSVEGAGPLAGIAAGLSACRTSWLLVIAGDMPHVTGELIDAMIATASTKFDFADISSAHVPLDARPVVGASSGAGAPNVASDECGEVDARAGTTSRRVGDDERGDDLDAVGVRSRGLPEPLLSVLHVRTRRVIERAIAGGRFKASRLLTDEGLRVRWLDADPDVVRNINSPEDLARTPGSK